MPATLERRLEQDLDLGLALKRGRRRRIELGIEVELLRKSAMQLLDRISCCESEHDREMAEPGTGHSILELQHAEQLEPIEHALFDEELAER